MVTIAASSRLLASQLPSRNGYGCPCSVSLLIIRKDLETFDWNGTEGPVGKSYDVLGDGSLVMVNIPGHSEGLCALKIKNAEGKYVLLFADGGYATKSWREMITSGITLDKKMQRQSLQWIREQSMSPDCIASLATHDTDVQPHVIEL